MRPDLEETEAQRQWREQLQKRGGPVKQTEPSETPPDPERSHPIPESE
jgi:hypothetical protein